MLKSKIIEKAACNDFTTDIYGKYNPRIHLGNLLSINLNWYVFHTQTSPRSGHIERALRDEEN
jgi:hypothetical protein